MRVIFGREPEKTHTLSLERLQAVWSSKLVIGAHKAGLRSPEPSIKHPIRSHYSHSESHGIVVLFAANSVADQVRDFGRHIFSNRAAHGMDQMHETRLKGEQKSLLVVERVLCKFFLLQIVK